MNTISVSLDELALRVEGSDGGAELGHGVKVCGEVVEHGNDMGRQFGAVGPLLGQRLDLHINTPI